jgi:16S rRNA (cytosine1402-N4)-methyltransferase
MEGNKKIEDGEYSSHVPVMVQESIQCLNIQPNNDLIWLDATAGAGGHLKAIIHKSGNKAQFIGLDCDLSALNLVKQNLREQSLLTSNVHLVHANFSQLEETLHNLNIQFVSGGILADLGISTMQLKNANRGFSFMMDGPLDMRMNQNNKKTASYFVNEANEYDLAKIIFEYGEERMSRPIARAIINARPIESTLQLADVVANVVSRYKGKHKVHPATRTFQAIRIAVNDELQILEQFLSEAISVLAPKARLVVITFHSLEDRLVKQVFKQSSINCICPPRYPICTCNHKALVKILTPKALIPDTLEVLANPLSRSAKLRAVEKL